MGRVTNTIFAVIVAGILCLGWMRTKIQAETKPETADSVSPAKKTATEEAGENGTGRKIPNLILRDTAGKDVGLADYNDKSVLVLVSMGTGCPIGNLLLPELIAIQKESGEWLQVIGINSQSGDSPEEIAKHAKEFDLNFPVLCDPQQMAADALGFKRTTETLVLDRQRVVRYHGRVDDRFGYTTKREEPQRRDLRIALEELHAGKPVSVASTPVEGCLISRVKPGTAGQVTFHQDVLPVLQRRCQECHHPGTAAPFSLLTYEDAVNWSAMMKEVVLDQRMPPWHADPRYSHFRNDRRLSPEDLRTLLTWIDQGTPEGDASKSPANPQFAEGWRIGKPDYVFEMPVEASLKATGTIPYQYYETETNFEEDVWVTAAEAIPGNRAVVHHIIVFAIPPKDQEQGKHDEANWIVAFAPGDEPLRLPEGVGRKIPKGSKLVWQVHYTATGKPEKDRSRVGFKITREKPAQQSRVYGIKNRRFKIPAEDPHYRVEANLRVPGTVDVLAFMPHMHVRGQSFEYRAKFPDGREQVLLSVPQFDFNWQTSYMLDKPITIPRGTLITCVAHYDNSSGNRANPDPKKNVTWGDQTWEEMMIGYVEYLE